eukprot:COSAG05_NODE_3692_length_1902_cov_2.459235_3_plen_131_part_01
MRAQSTRGRWGCVRVCRHLADTSLHTLACTADVTLHVRCRRHRAICGPPPRARACVTEVYLSSTGPFDKILGPLETMHDPDLPTGLRLNNNFSTECRQTHRTVVARGPTGVYMMVWLTRPRVRIAVCCLLP